MKKVLLLLALISLLPIAACKQKESKNSELRSAEVELVLPLKATNAYGDALYDFGQDVRVAYVTDMGFQDKALVIPGSQPQSIKGSFNVEVDAQHMWAFSTSGTAGGNFPVPATQTRTEAAPAALEGMAFCSETVLLKGTTPYDAEMVPLTAGVIFDIIDTKGTWSGTRLTGLTVTAASGKTLTGTIAADLKTATVDEIQNASASLEIACEGDFWVGSATQPTSLGAVVVPCNFTGTITVKGPLFQEATLNITSPQTCQAGYVKHITVDLARAKAAVAPSYPKRLGIFGDSISTFGGQIPSSHRQYYPAGDVDAWTKTYWGLLSGSQYWNCAIDMNTSWSGSSVADGKEGSVRTPFVDPSRYTLFTNPDVIILFGGTNDAIASNGIGLGDFSYDTALDQMQTTKRFRDAYIFLIRKLKELHPAVRIICIIGTDITGEYGNSVEAIAQHYCLPYVDFRGEKDSKVTIYAGSHPDANGHAYKAKKIFEQTQYLFQ